MPTDTWNDFATGWDNEPDVREYAEKVFRSWNCRVAPLIENASEIKVLDFGCGTGLLSEKLAPLCREIVAVDASIGMIEVLDGKIAKSGAANITSLLTTISGESIVAHQSLLSQFDLVVASSVCSFLPDFGTSLRDIATIMRPGGIFVHWDWLDDMPIDTVQRAFASAGLDCVSIGREFKMSGRHSPVAVVMGIGQLPR